MKEYRILEVKEDELRQLRNKENIDEILNNILFRYDRARNKLL